MRVTHRDSDEHPGAAATRRAASVRARREHALFARAQQGDARAREELTQRFLGLARSAAVRYRRPSEPLDDVMQVASLGLLKAIDRFDPQHGVAFSSYAVPTIMGEVKRWFRDRTWSVRPPRDLQELVLLIEGAREDLARDLGRPPSVPELAERVGRTDEEVLEGLQAGRGRRATSLSQPQGGEEDGVTLGDVLGDAEDGYARAEDRATIANLVETLSEREREVLRLRFEEDLTQAEIGEIVGVSQMQVSRILRTAIERLRFAARS